METVSSSFFPAKRKVLFETNAPIPTPKFVEIADRKKEVNEDDLKEMAAAYKK